MDAVKNCPQGDGGGEISPYLWSEIIDDQFYWLHKGVHIVLGFADN